MEDTSAFDLSVVVLVYFVLRNSICSILSLRVSSEICFSVLMVTCQTDFMLCSVIQPLFGVAKLNDFLKSS